MGYRLWIIELVYIVVVVLLAATTIIEKYTGSAFVQLHIYGAWWFSLLWAILAATGIAWIIKRRMRNVTLILLHLSFVVILAGAFITHLTARQGQLHLRTGSYTDTYKLNSTDGLEEICTLPFTIRLDSFRVSYHEGTKAASDYESRFTVMRERDTIQGAASMNNIFSYNGIRLYQNSFDDDMRGSTLTVNSDPYGIPVTYTGYAMLFIALIYMLFDPKGRYRQLLHHPALKRGLLTVVALFTVTAFTSPLSAQPTLSKDAATHFGKIYISYNDRICPTETYALDFTKKLYGKGHYKEFTADQVLTGFLFWGNEWNNEKIIKVKGGALRERMHLPSLCSVNDFFKKDMGYILGPLVQEYYGGNHDKTHQQAMQVDDKLRLIMELRQGMTLKFFPIKEKGVITWYGPADNLPVATASRQAAFAHAATAHLFNDAHHSDMSHFTGVTDDIRRFQYRNGSNSIPSQLRTRAEHIYNKVSFATILFMLNLTMGFLSLGWFIYRMTRQQRKEPSKAVEHCFLAILFLSLLALTCCLALRWIISGNIPMGNGYETTLLLAWLVIIASLVAYRKAHIMLTFGFLLSGFFLLVSHISYMDPQIGQLMPVLNSPLLSIHVSIIMAAYALLSFTFICALMAFILKLIQRNNDMAAEALQVLSQLFLHPALTCLGLGIFIGAIWANVSWGQYWSWDPKETWALITFMVYGASVHSSSIPQLRRPMVYHAYQLLAFLTLLMTYFGVNYFLGGMHSYA
jgi:cytochrome c-type biogenesis protein CcsB